VATSGSTRVRLSANIGLGWNLEVRDSDKHTSLLRQGANYGNKKGTKTLITTFSIMTPSIKGGYVTVSINNTQHE
jgi:hypothetical protein